MMMSLMLMMLMLMMLMMQATPAAARLCALKKVAANHVESLRQRLRLLVELC